MVSRVIQKRLDKVKDEYLDRFEQIINSDTGITPDVVLKILSESFTRKRISGFPIDKRKDHVQMVWHFDQEWIEENSFEEEKKMATVSLWRLFVVPGGYAWVVGVNFQYLLTAKTEMFEQGIISCENPEEITEFLHRVNDSIVGNYIKNTKPDSVYTDSGLVGEKEEFLDYPTFEIEVVFTCEDEKSCQDIYQIFDIIVKEECKDFLGLTNAKDNIERRDVFWEYVQDKLEWTQDHQYEAVWGYALSLNKIGRKGKEASLNFTVDIIKGDFIRQISAFLKELGATTVKLIESEA